MTPTFDDFDRDEEAWSLYCDEMAEREEFYDYDEEEYDEREAALTDGERNR